VLYLDSSAILKLVLEESETSALRAWLGERPLSVTSGVAPVEVRRTVRLFAETALTGAPRGQNTASDLNARTEAVMSGIVVLTIDDAILSRAAALDPPLLRTLDAVHLASALSLEELEAFVTYDHDLGEAAHQAGLVVTSPGT
jgi:hypothetical protein